MNNLTCPKCGNPNRQGAKFCGVCGSVLDGTKNKPSQPDQSSSSSDVLQLTIGDIVKGAGKVAKKVDKNIIQPVMEAMDQFFEEQTEASGNPDHLPGTIFPSSQSQGTGAIPTSQAIPLKKPGEWINKYVVQNSKPLKRSNYYRACMALCENGHLNPQVQIDKCGTCQRNLQIYLIHETLSGAQGGNGDYRTKLVKWPITPGILKHVSIFDHEGNQYVVTNHPLEPWESLAEIHHPVADTNWIVENCARIGEAVLELSLKNYVLARMPSPSQEILEATIIGNDRKLSLVDLSIFVPISQSSPTHLPSSPDNQKRYVFLLGQILYTLASGNARDICRDSGDFSDVPTNFRGLIDRARRGESGDLGTFIGDLRQIQQSSLTLRGLRQMSGYGTDIGQQRDHNEDTVDRFSVGVQQSQDSPDTGLYLVADGMGGQDAGEKASKLVVEVIHNSVEKKFASLQAGPRLNRETVKLNDTMTPEKILQEAVLEANRILIGSRQKSGSDRGTTVTCALIVGNTCGITNVGDSRTYLLHNGKLEQVTRDHSLVARLLEAGVIKADEVRSHPQRNQIYRTLGDKPKLDVDTFTRVLMAGDRLLLCSDGLWEMVLDQEMERILKTASSPQAACDQLIKEANEAGGADNISVIVVWIE